MAERIAALSGWGQPSNALASVAPEATPIDYARHKNISEALRDVAAQAHGHDVMIGWSLGGQLAVRAMAAGLIQPKKLVLIAAPFQFMADRRDTYRRFHSNYASHPERTLHKAWELLIKGDKRESSVREWLEKIDKGAVLENNWLYWLGALEGFSCREVDFAAFPPTLIIHGDRDVVVEVEQSQHFFDALPDARLMIVKGSGHAPHWHDANAVREAIEEFANVR